MSLYENWPARPTSYRSVAFRSRLEARWAAFFDAAGWDWCYEPMDTGAIGWLPDFRLCDSLLVEVKPMDWRERESLLDRADLQKVWRNSQRQPVLVLGSSLVPGAGARGPRMGRVLFDQGVSDAQFHWDTCRNELSLHVGRYRAMQGRPGEELLDCEVDDSRAPRVARELWTDAWRSLYYSGLCRR